MTEPEIKKGQVWRRKKNGRLVQVIGVVDKTGVAGSWFYDVRWETMVRPFRRGQSYGEYWYKNCELVEDVDG